MLAARCRIASVSSARVAVIAVRRSALAPGFCVAGVIRTQIIVCADFLGFARLANALRADVSDRTDVVVRTWVRVEFVVTPDLGVT